MSSQGRVTIAKLGLDGHDVGARFVARLLRDSGFEVVYLGIRQTPEAVVDASAQEDADVIGISILSGAHTVLVTKLLRLLDEGGDDTPVVVGGVIPREDRPTLLAAGVHAIFDAGTPVSDIVRTFSELAGRRLESSANGLSTGR